MPKAVRPIRIEGNIAFITLTRGCEAVIDASDVSLIDKWNWCAMVKRDTCYAYRNDHSNGRQKTIRMHRVIMKAPKGVQVDHINRCGTDNRKENLRLATNAQNQRNARTRTDNKSGYKGVTLDKRTSRWRAMIRVDGVLKSLGFFDDPKIAHEAYKKASEKYHGEFGRSS
jgi:hypothetical protein